MKNYIYLLVIFAMTFLCCEKPEGDSGSKGTNSVDAAYAVLLKNNGAVSAQLINANGRSMTLNPSQSALGEHEVPSLWNNVGSQFIQVTKNVDCSSTLILHDFKNDTKKEFTVFNELGTCGYTANAITFTATSVLIAFQHESLGKPNGYKLRIYDVQTNQMGFEEIDLVQKPVGLVISNNRLFMTTVDEEVTHEYTLNVIDLNSMGTIFTKGLGYNVRRIFKNNLGDVLISYDGLHALIDSGTMALEYTNYETGKEPNFTNFQPLFFDAAGSMYYCMDPAIFSDYEKVPAIYDFAKNLTIIYSFENFLTTAQRNLEFKIGNATAVAYDNENDLILIGYNVAGSDTLGGLLRIDPNPLPDQPALVDNIPLNGIPHSIFVN